MEPNVYPDGGSGRPEYKLTAPHLYAVAFARDTIQVMKTVYVLVFVNFPDFRPRIKAYTFVKYVCYLAVTDTKIEI